ncbi:TetR/AcrR family transcriptional regulator [Limosilactobacillus mucosae]|uniref:TetR/AcrR family transcriptional regulator n=1 Tax=Limosilactobacillus mucosae TaxID=97478 RepID=UPI0022E65CF8|nr:TetR-like C-terminal domain-containing protein [Limosilactobacillus mucosae]
MKPAKKTSQLKIEDVFLKLAQDQPVERITITQICKLAKVNRTTFYTNYPDIYDLKDKVRERMIAEYSSLFDDQRGASQENYLRLFQSIQANQTFYKTYFKLGFDIDYQIVHYDQELAAKLYNNQFIDYHSEFFRAGITAVIKKWLNNDCRESPATMLKII